MENIIKYAVECESVYEVAALIVVLIGFIFLLSFSNKTIQFVLPYIYKIVCKLCNTLVKYKDIRTKTSVKDVSIETELHK